MGGYKYEREPKRTAKTNVRTRRGPTKCEVSWEWRGVTDQVQNPGPSKLSQLLQASGTQSPCQRSYNRKTQTRVNPPHAKKRVCRANVYVGPPAFMWTRGRHGWLTKCQMLQMKARKAERQRKKERKKERKNERNNERKKERKNERKNERKKERKNERKKTKERKNERTKERKNERKKERKKERRNARYEKSRWAWVQVFRGPEPPKWNFGIILKTHRWQLLRCTPRCFRKLSECFLPTQLACEICKALRKVNHF